MSDVCPLPGPLTGLKILELADEKGQFCGKPRRPRRDGQIEPPGSELASAGGHSSTTFLIPGAVCLRYYQYVQTRHYPKSPNRGRRRLSGGWR